MLTLGWKELACVLLYAALVGVGHTLFHLTYPRTQVKTARLDLDPRLPAAVFVLGGVLGALLIDSPRPDAVVGPGLILLTAPLAYRAARAGRAHHPLLTPTLMLAAALATTSQSVFTMTIVFLPMCVAAMAGVGMAEVFAAHARGEQLAFSKIGGWGLRFMAESLLGALIASAAIVWLR